MISIEADAVLFSGAEGERHPRWLGGCCRHLLLHLPHYAGHRLLHREEEDSLSRLLLSYSLPACNRSTRYHGCVFSGSDE